MDLVVVASFGASIGWQKNEGARAKRVAVQIVAIALAQGFGRREFRDG
jgi:hypothetical protein